MEAKGPKNEVRSVELARLSPHPDNPNRMSAGNFARLVRNIERTGRYEPLVVRPLPGAEGKFQVINGHHRLEALRRLGYDRADVVVWDVDDAQTDTLLATLNRLGGSDDPAQKIALLKRLSRDNNARQLARLLPYSAGQIKRLVNLRLPTAPAELNDREQLKPMVFFLTDEQRKTVETALLSLWVARLVDDRCRDSAGDRRGRGGRPGRQRRDFARHKAEMLMRMAQMVLDDAVVRQDGQG